MSELENKKPSELTAQDRRGHEERTTAEDMIIPRAALLQKTSPQLDQDPNLKAGMIVNSLSGEMLPEEFIPVKRHVCWIRFNPRDKRDPNYDANFAEGALIWKSENPDDERVLTQSKFGPNGEKPAATKFINFLAYFPGHDLPVVIPFSKTSFNTGRVLNTLVSATPGAMFNGKYKLSAIRKENEKGVYFVFKVTKAGKPTEAEFAQAEEYYNRFAGVKDLKVHEEDDTAEIVPEAGAQQDDTDKIF